MDGAGAEPPRLLFWEMGMNLITGLSRIGVLLLLTVGLTAPAAAGWRYAEWGMTELEVEEASDGEAFPSGDDNAAYWEILPGLTAPARFGPFDMEAEFYFDKTNGLTSVRLLPVNNIWCLDMMKYLLRNYSYQGPKEDAYIWLDPSGGNQVQLSQFSRCIVTFSAAAEDDASTAAR